ncbi:MAG TPA: hypothetical protein VHO25_10065 [Polyangiaceae bacterium]|nr:hypothetical protein [Polyangiaceae bacterium]
MRSVADTWYDPVWWGALGLLLVNDHVLKRSVDPGTFAATVTGKLSDVAGLIVAPMLVGALAGRVVGTPRAVRYAFAGVVVLFCALKVSPWLAGTWVSAWELLGVAQQLTADPTDLLALPVAYLAYARMMSRCGRDMPRSDREGAAWMQRSAVLLGGLGCLATSYDWDDAPIPPAVRNATEAQVSVAIQHYARNLPCGEAVDASAFSSGQATTLAPGEWVSLLAAGTGTDGGGVDDLLCGAALISASGLESVIVRWNLRGIARTGTAEARNEVAAGTVYLEQFGAELRPALGQGMIRVEAQ